LRQGKRTADPAAGTGHDGNPASELHVRPLRLP
jgi:hypothetical protein